MDDVLVLSVAALIGEPTRAEMLLCLMDGRSYPMSDLAAMAHVSLPTASHHLELLVKAGLIRSEKQGRHRYHHIAEEQVAELLEQLGSFQRAALPNVRLNRSQKALSDCRVCYSHLAGKVGVQLRVSLEQQGLLIRDGMLFNLTTSGLSFLTDLGIHLAATGRDSKACLDWTERVHHIGGALGRALFETFLERNWIIRGDAPREIVVTKVGTARLAELFPTRDR